LAQLEGFKKLANVDEALSIFLKTLKLKYLPATKVSLQFALERILAKDITANDDLPSFDRSAVDGYAIRAQDSFEASQFNPKTLVLTESEEVGENEAKQIWTGNALQKGADAVIMLEYTRRVNGKIDIWKPVTPGENVSKRGEDIIKGQVALKAGTRLKSHHLGLLGALGEAYVNVVRRPKVAILSTGNELVELGHTPKFGQVIAINRLILSNLCLELGAEAYNLGIAKDDVDKIADKIREGLKQADVIITTGGTSVGHADLVPIAVNQIGKPGVIVHGVAMRPGMPTALAILAKKPVFVLSGNPVAAMVGFEVFVRPVLLRMLGIESESKPVLKAKLTRRVSSVLGRRVFLRVYAFEREGEFFAEPIRVRGSSILSTMTKANGYVIIPENCEVLEEGEWVLVHLFDKIGVQSAK
jgi:molybdopterin molybdotransferase